MILHGILSIVNGESKLDDGTLLARCSEASPLDAATAFVEGKGCEDGDFIVVTGSSGTSGDVAVFCIDDAKTVGSSVPNLLTISPKGLSAGGTRRQVQKAELSDTKTGVTTGKKANRQKAKKNPGKRP
jgi:hypothetical protein